MDFAHDRLSVFGIGEDIDTNQWRAIFRQLIALGYLNVDIQGHGSLLLTRASRPLLRGETSLRFRKQREAEKQKRATNKTSVQISDHHKQLWESLRLLRKEIAEKEGVPAYVVFHDATLMEMLAQQPKNLSDMRQITGVGEAKLSRYGQAFVNLISTTIERENPEKSNQEASWQGSLNLHRHGLSVSEIAEKRSLKTNTIYLHLAHAIASGEVQLHDVIDLNQQSIDSISATIIEKTSLSEPRLKAVFDAFGGQYEYGVLHCLLADIQYTTALTKTTAETKNS